MHGDDVRMFRERRNEIADGVRVRVTDVHMESREVRGTERLPGGGFEDSLPKRVVVVAMPRREHFDGVAIEVDRRDIDPVDGRPGHHPDSDHGRIVARQGLATAS